MSTSGRKSISMKFVSETTIDKAFDRLEAQAAGYPKVIDSFQQEQPVLIAYLFSESLELLTEDERQYLLFLVLVIWESVKMTDPDIPFVTEEQLGIAEEQNWEILQEQTETKFRDRIGVFFENYPQEHLLAFAEDALAQEEDDEQIVTKEGSEPLFICLKTVIDCLTAKA